MKPNHAAKSAALLSLVLGAGAFTAEATSFRRAALDFNGDSLSDMAVYHAEKGNWYILFNGTGNSRVQNRRNR